MITAALLVLVAVLIGVRSKKPILPESMPLTCWFLGHGFERWGVTPATGEDYGVCPRCHVLRDRTTPAYHSTFWTA